MTNRVTECCRSWIARRARRILVGLFIFFVVLTGAGFFVLPPVLKHILTDTLSKNFRREVTIRQIKTNPYTLSMTVRGLLVKERSSAEAFASLDEAFLNLEGRSILRMAPVLKEIRITGPYIRIARNRDLSYNFSDLLERQTPPGKAKSAPPRFSLNNIRIEKGSIDFVDAPEETRHTVRELNVGIPFLSNIPSYVERFVQPHFSARIDDAVYTLDGRTKPFADSLETFIDVDIKDLNIPHYLAYLPVKMNFKVLSAYLDTSAKISFIETKAKKPSLTVTGRLSLKNLAVNDEQDRTVFKLPRLDVSIAPSEPLSQAIHLSTVSIQSPEWDIRRDKEGLLNTRLLLYEKGRERVEARKEGEASPFFIDIDGMVLSGGKVRFSDLSGSTPFKTVVEPMDLKIDHFSNRKDKKAHYALTLKTEANESIRDEGDFCLEPLWLEGALDVSSVPLKKYRPYYNEKLLFDIEDGRVDLSGRHRYAAGAKDSEINLSGASLTLKAVRLRKAGENQDFVRIPNLAINETDIDFTRKELKIGNVSTERGELTVKRLKNGDLNLLTLMPPAVTAEEPPAKTKAGPKPVEGEKPWLVSLTRVLIDRYRIRLEDDSTPSPTTLTVQNLRLKGERISTAKNSKGRVAASLLLNGKGTVSTTGTVSLEPFSADLKTELRAIEIAPFQPYFTEKVKIAVTGGAISTNGTLSFITKDDQTRTTFKGEASVTGFSTIDKLTGEDLLKFESLALSGLNVGYAPLSVAIKGVSLTDVYALVEVDGQGRINLQEVLATGESTAETAHPGIQEAASASPAGRAPSQDVRIDQVTFQGGRIDFSDKSVKPEFSTRISEMGGRVSGLSAEQNSMADVELRAKLNEYAPLEITGKINPLRDDLFVELKARIKDLDLSPASPYSGKYAGYTIEKGKLSVDVNYSIEKRKLESQNNIIINQFTFGEKVDSPQATTLPVKLAVALLKDRKGEIKLDLPVTGSLDDPQFSVWRVIVRILVNLIAKAATSPFALLGSVFGGSGEELSYVEFDYGSTVITEPNVKKLDVVSRALEDRPSLKLDIEGHVDLENDREGLKQLLFKRKIKAQKLNEMVKKGEPAPPVDEVKIDPPEYEKYLKMAYKAEKFPKPKNVVGMTKDIPVPEIEKLILTHTVVNDDDLRILASRRAMNVKELILKSGKVTPERAFIVEQKSLEPEKKEKTRPNRVDLKLNS